MNNRLINRISLYANGPFGNHGCEALYRSLGRLCHVEYAFTLDDRDDDSSLWNSMKICAENHAEKLVGEIKCIPKDYPANGAARERKISGELYIRTL